MRQGIGTAYLEHILTFIRPRHPLTLICETRESKPQVVRFLQKNGFVEMMRFRYFELDVPAFEPARFQGVMEKVETAAIEIISVTELQRREPDWQRILYNLHWELMQDVPTTIERTRGVADDGGFASRSLCQASSWGRGINSIASFQIIGGYSL